MKSIIMTILLIGCTYPKSLLMRVDIEIRKVNNKIVIKGDSNVVNFNYVRIYGIDEYQIDSLIHHLDTIQ